VRCVFCLLERAPSQEHIFPLAIGGMRTIDRVCEECNSTLGATVDAALIDHPFILMRRWELRLPGNSGRVPDALKEVLGTGTLENDESQRVTVSTNSNTGTLDLRVLYNVKQTVNESGTIVRQIIVDERDAKSLGKIIQRERKRAGQPPFEQGELYQLVEQIIEQGPERLEKPTLYHRSQIDLIEFKKGLLKIAYELAFVWLGESYLEDPTAAMMRDIVLGRLDETQSRIAGRIDFGTDSDALHLWADDKDCHIAYTFVAGKQIGVCMKVFDVFSGVVCVTQCAERYLSGANDPLRIRFLRIDPLAAVCRESSFVEEVGRIALNQLSASRIR
jgi:HNH endonuclease